MGGDGVPWTATRQHANSPLSAGAHWRRSRSLTVAAAAHPRRDSRSRVPIRPAPCIYRGSEGQRAPDCRCGAAGAVGRLIDEVPVNPWFGLGGLLVVAAESSGYRPPENASELLQRYTAGERLFPDCE